MDSEDSSGGDSSVEDEDVEEDVNSKYVKEQIRGFADENDLRRLRAESEGLPRKVKTKEKDSTTTTDPLDAWASTIHSYLRKQPNESAVLASVGQSVQKPPGVGKGTKLGAFVASRKEFKYEGHILSLAKP